MPISEIATLRAATAPTTSAFFDLVMTNPINAALVERLPQLNLPQCFLTAGALFQTAWNHRSGFAPTANIKDYDVFYSGAADVSWEAEDAAIRMVKSAFADLPIPIEVKNQARVHLWYEQKFSRPYLPLKSAREGIDRYLVECSCVGIEIGANVLYAPNGLGDLWNGILKMNPANPDRPLFIEKARDYRQRWNWLSIEGDEV